MQRLLTHERPAARRGRRHNLPVAVTSFVGRADALDAIDRGLESTRLLTLTGTGGIGKTRLALQVASRLVDSYADGVWLAELAALDDGALLPRAVATALGIRVPPTRVAIAALLDAMESRELLLVLDNCEHLIGACAELAERLLRACPGLRILATSREPLGIDGETVWRVPGLTLPDGAAGPSCGGDREGAASPAPTEAVQLFLDRARAARPDLPVDAGSTVAVAEICRRLDGLPLAIELAAARVGVLSVAQIADRLDDRFRLLTVGSRTALPRHQTLRSLIDWSYDLLADDEQLVLRRLSVFVGGWTLEAAEAIDGFGLPVSGFEGRDRPSEARPLRGGHIGYDVVRRTMFAGPRPGIPEPNTLDVLGRLTAKSLVLAEEQGGEVRYRLLETIREYALAKLAEAGDEDAARAQHLDWCLALAERAEAHLQGPDQVTWLARLEADAGNLRSALSWAQTSGEIEAGLRLGRALWQFWRAHGHLAEGRTWLETLLERSETACPSLESLRGEVAVRAGNLSLERGDSARARTHIEWGLEAARSLGSRALAADALTQLGHAARQEHRLADARALYLESLELRRQMADRLGEAWALGSLGHLALAEGDLGQARACYQEGLNIARELDNPWEVATFLRLLGKQASEAGEWPTAYAHYSEGLGLFRDLGDRRSVIATLEGLAGVAAATGRSETALRLAGATESLRQSLDVPLSAHDQARVARQIEPARLALGCRRSARLVDLGRSLSLDEAVAAALEAGLDDKTPSPRLVTIGAIGSDGASLGSTAAAAARLTAREREVAALVAAGAGNLQISADLSISRRTVEAHVTAILNKLGLSTRTQMAVWAVEHGLRPTASVEV